MAPDLPVAPEFVRARMAVSGEGRADITVAAVRSDGTERQLAAWADLVTDADRLLLSRSPDGARVAVAAGRFVRTLNVADGSVIGRAPIGHSEPSVVFGWPAQGEVVVRDTSAPSGPDLPLGNGMVLRIEGDIEQDDGFSGGHVASIGLAAVRHLRPLRVAVAVDGREVVVHDDAAGTSVDAAERGGSVGAAGGAGSGAGSGDLSDGETAGSAPRARGARAMHWPPAIGSTSVLLRHTVDDGRRCASQAPWHVDARGAVSEIPIELGVSPVGVLPDGRFVLPGASALWRDGADEPISTIGLDGAVEPLMVAGEPIGPPRVLQAVASDLLPVPRPPNGQALWSADDGLWVHAARVLADGSALLLLLADAKWLNGLHPPEASDWLIVRVALDEVGGIPAEGAVGGVPAHGEVGGSSPEGAVDAVGGIQAEEVTGGPIELVARGTRADGAHLAIAL